MKRLLLTLIFLMVPALCFADGTITVSSDTVIADGSGNPVFREIKLICTADASAATFPDTDIAYDTTGIVHGSLAGWWLYSVECIGNTGGTEVTDDSDLYIKDAQSVDLIGGNGVDKLDDDTDYEFPPLTGGFASTVPLMGAPTIDIDGNAVTSAVAHIYLRMYR